MSFTGIKEFIKSFKEPYNYKNKAKQRLKDNGERATKELIEKEILILKKEYQDSADRGSKLHSIVQNNKIKIKDCIVEGRNLDSFNKKIDPLTNTLENNKTYIEKKIISEKYKLIGYSDEVSIKNNYINIEDIKTFKKIYRNSSIRLKNGFILPPTYFYTPIDNLQDCNYNEVALQLSFYMYILWTYNKHLKPGNITIRHIITNDKDDILEEKIIDVPYLIEDVKKLLKYRLKNGIS